MTVKTFMCKSSTVIRNTSLKQLLKTNIYFFIIKVKQSKWTIWNLGNMSSEQSMSDSGAIEKEANWRLTFVNIKQEPKPTVDDVLMYSTNGLSCFNESSMEAPDGYDVTVDEAISNLYGVGHKCKGENEEKSTQEILQKVDIKIETKVFEDKMSKITGYETENAHTKTEAKESREAFEAKTKAIIKSETESGDISSIQKVNTSSNSFRYEERNREEENNPLQYIKEEGEITIECVVLDEKNAVKTKVVDGK